jgi:anion-transporting  ArsA/GET3 family ATPase
VLGKGGVGKSTIAAALLLSLQRAGARVLGIELDAPGGLSRTLGVELPEANVAVRSASGVHLAWFDGALALAEYLSRKVRLGRLATPIFQHPLYEAFVHAAPGVKELMAIGKVRDELLLQKRWDAVVVDAGASGHALEYLRMPAVAAAAFHRGRVHREAKQVHASLSDANITAIHVVTTAEEMPVLEAVESVQRIRSELQLPLGHVILNRCLELPPDDIQATIQSLARLAPDAPMLFSARRALGWIEIQERYAADLERDVGVKPLRMPQLIADELTLLDLETLAPGFTGSARGIS